MNFPKISKEIRKTEAGLYYLRLIEIEKNKKQILENVNEQDDEISAIKIDLNHNTELLNQENAKLAPLRDRKLESLAKLQKINLDMTNLEEEEKRIKKLSLKLENALETIDSDLEREKSISLDASLNDAAHLSYTSRGTSLFAINNVRNPSSAYASKCLSVSCISVCSLDDIFFDKRSFIILSAPLVYKIILPSSLSKMTLLRLRFELNSSTCNTVYTLSSPNTFTVTVFAVLKLK